MQPRYTHDCSDCHLVRQTTREDWYVCRGAASLLSGIVLGRFGDAPADYWSMPVAVILSETRSGGRLRTARAIARTLKFLLSAVDRGLA